MRPRKGPTQRRSQELVESVVQAAVEVISVEGMSNASIAKIADRAGVSPGSIYQYFETKESLFGESAERQLILQLLLFLHKLNEWRDLPIKELNHNFTGFVADYLLRNAKVLRDVYTRANELGKGDTVLAARKQVIEVLAEIFRARREEMGLAEPLLTATVLVHATMGVLTSTLADQDRPFPYQDVRTELIRMVDRYLAS